MYCSCSRAASDNEGRVDGCHTIVTFLEYCGRLKSYIILTQALAQATFISSTLLAYVDPNVAAHFSNRAVSASDTDGRVRVSAAAKSAPLTGGDVRRPSLRMV